MTIAIAGAGGMLGRAFCEALGDRALALGSPAIDVTDAASVERALGPGLEAVVNCTAYTNVDGAETEEARANAINGDGVKHLLARCDALGIPLVHYSTDYVFDGQARVPYGVDHRTAPASAYGRSKHLGETHVIARDRAHLLIRTSWLYAPWAKNFVRTIAALAKEREVLRVVDDQRGRPTSAEHLARATLALMEKRASGVFHVTDGGECTWFEFAREIAARVAPACRVEPCTTAEFPRPAPRPAYSVLDLSKTEALIGPMPDWRSNLAAVLAQLE